jgi:hypothetical protein
MSPTFGTIQAKVSLFSRCDRSQKPQREITIDDLALMISKGEYKAEVEALRSAPESEQKNLKMTTLPAVTPAGTFTTRNTEGFAEASGFFVLDFDNVPNPANLRDELIADPFVLMSFVSPSGNGVKALVRIERIANNEDAHRLFASLQHYYGNMGLKVSADKSGKDISRLCIVSYDPDIKQDNEARVFCIADHPVPMELEIQDVVKDAIASGLENIKGVDSTVLPPSKATEQAALEHIRNTIKLGSKAKAQDAGESRHSFMRSACTTGWRYHLGGHITPEQGLDAILDEYGKLFPNDADRAEDVVRTWEAKKTRELALTHGALHPAPKYAKPADEVTPERIAELWQLAFVPTWTNKPPDIPDAIQLGGENVGTFGSITVIEAFPKQGKSAVCGAIYASAINPNISDEDSLGFHVELPEDKSKVLYFDTEQSSLETWTSWQRAVSRAGYEQGSQLPEHIEYSHICMTNIPSYSDRRELILWMIENTDGLGLVIIDGIGDLVAGVNEEKESNELLDRIRHLASTKSVSIFLTVHLNPSAQGQYTKARGHLGSELMRRVKTRLRITKDVERQYHTINIEQNRSGSDNQKTYFMWSDERKRHIRCDADDIPRESTQGKQDKAMLDEIMGEVAFKHKDLVALIMERKGVKEARAKGIIRAAVGKYIYKDFGSYRFKRNAED